MGRSQVGIIGIPFDEKSSFLKGASKGPDEIRKGFNDGSGNFYSESGFEVIEGTHFSEKGNLDIKNYPGDIQSGISDALTECPKLVTLGGDHSISYPIIKAFNKVYPGIHVLQLDAHTDLYEEYDGDPYSHACPFSRIMEQKLVQSLTQIGVRTITPQQRNQIDRFGVHTYTMRDWVKGIHVAFQGPLYISLDMDVFDPAHAPGISHYDPGGMTPREVLELILNIDVPIVGADIVELNPTRDKNGITSMLAAKLLKEIIAKMNTL